MKKFRRIAMPAPPNVSRRVPRTRFEIAAQLLRLEFESARLNREIETARMRAAAAELRLARTTGTIRASLVKLMGGTEP